VRWSAGNIEQSLYDPELCIRREHRIARPGRAEPIAQQIGGQHTVTLAKVLYDR
jgi:hypothetical protein